MKSLRFPLAVLLGLGCVCTVQSRAQQLPAQQLPAEQPVWLRSAPAAAQPQPRPDVRRVSRPPEDTRASVKARISTAQAGATRMTAPPMTTLPAFNATALDGHTLAVASAAHLGHWLLVYRRDNCVPCDQTLLALAASSSPDLRNGVAYTIVVGDTTASGLVSLRAKFTTLNSATWLADSNSEAFNALKPRGTPMLYAMNGDRIAWTAAGNLGNPALVEQRASAWLAEPADKKSGPTPGRGTVTP